MRTELERPIGAVHLAYMVRLEDNWFAVKELDEGTYAIGEPAYHQCNWSYLISDGDQSLLWDTGSGRRPIAPLIDRLGAGRVTAFPSHLHFDHLGGITAFGPVMLADLPMVRALEKDGAVTPTEEMFLGAYEDLEAPTFEVGRWAAPGSEVQVGERQLQVLHTPGHSPDSVSLWEPDRNRLYAADFVYRGELYAQTPGASLTDYRSTLHRLMQVLPVQVEIVCAHGRVEHGVSDMPRLGYGDLEDLSRAIEGLLGTRPHDGEMQVNDHMALLYSKASFVERHEGVCVPG